MTSIFENPSLETYHLVAPFTSPTSTHPTSILTSRTRIRKIIVFLAIIIFWSFLILEQSVQLLTTITFLADPAISEDYTVMGVNGNSHRITEIIACRSAVDCSQQSCRLRYENSNVSAIVLYPFDLNPPSTCKFSIVSMIETSLQSTRSTLAVIFLSISGGLLIIWSILIFYFFLRNSVHLYYLKILLILGKIPLLIGWTATLSTMVSSWAPYPNPVQQLQITLQLMILFLILGETVIEILL